MWLVNGSREDGFTTVKRKEKKNTVNMRRGLRGEFMRSALNDNIDTETIRCHKLPTHMQQHVARFEVSLISLVCFSPPPFAQETC